MYGKPATGEHFSPLRAKMYKALKSYGPQFTHRTTHILFVRHTANSAVPIEAFLWYFSKILRTYYARRWVREIVAQKYSISWVRLRFVQCSHIFRTFVREKIELCPALLSILIHFFMTI